MWQTDRIARIDPASGKVVAWIDLGGLLNPSERRSPDNVLNGIAYDAAGDRLFVTGETLAQAVRDSPGEENRAVAAPHPASSRELQ